MPAAAPAISPTLETVTLTAVPVLRVGRWNGDSYTLDDLDEMVSAFNEGNAGIVPPGKLGHDRDQQLIQQDGFPAVGYVSRLYVSGGERDGTLYADFRDVPKRIGNLIKARAYNQRSAEVYFNLKHGKKTYPRVLKAVSFLGADIPAVSGLADIEALYGMSREAVAAQYTIADTPTGDVHVYELPADMSYDDLNESLRTAVRARYPSGEYGPYVVATYEDSFVFCDQQGKHFRLTYALGDAGAVTIGDAPQPVKRMTIWRPTAEAERAYADDADGGDDEDYAGQLDAAFARVEERMKGAKGMSALRLFMREARSKLATMKPRKGGTYSEQEQDTGAPAPQEDVMSEAVLKALGLAADADEAAQLAKITELSAKAAEAETAKAGQAEREGQYSALVSENRQMAERVANLERERATEKATAAIDEAIKAGKLVPAQRETMLTMAVRDPEWFKGYVDATPVLSIFGERGASGAGNPDTDASVQLSKNDELVAKQMGLDPEKVRAEKEKLLTRR